MYLAQNDESITISANNKSFDSAQVLNQRPSHSPQPEEGKSTLTKNFRKIVNVNTGQNFYSPSKWFEPVWKMQSTSYQQHDGEFWHWSQNWEEKYFEKWRGTDANQPSKQEKLIKSMQKRKRMKEKDILNALDKYSPYAMQLF